MLDNIFVTFVFPPPHPFYGNAISTYITSLSRGGFGGWAPLQDCKIDVKSFPTWQITAKPLSLTARKQKAWTRASIW